MKVINLLLAAGIIVTLLKLDHYKAIRHEFYQVWDTINLMRGVQDEN